MWTGCTHRLRTSILGSRAGCRPDVVSHQDSFAGSQIGYDRVGYDGRLRLSVMTGSVMMVGYDGPLGLVMRAEYGFQIKVGVRKVSDIRSHDPKKVCICAEYGGAAEVGQVERGHRHI